MSVELFAAIRKINLRGRNTFADSHLRGYFYMNLIPKTCFEDVRQ